MAIPDTMSPDSIERSLHGFSLMEMLIVLAIISIILVATIPSGGGRVDQAAIAETVELMKNYKPQIEGYYRSQGEFPVDNATAGLPEADSIVGNYMSAVFLLDGALHVRLGNKIRAELRGKYISLRPIFVPGVANAPISWVCGTDTVPADMVAAGENRTDISSASLPVACR